MNRTLISQFVAECIIRYTNRPRFGAICKT